jgi:glycosyltransferase involved in cell wall biosynthesis
MIRPIMSDHTPLPSISIVIPTFRGGDTLEACLESLLGQSYPSLEIIVIDGGSEDATGDILQRYEDRITYWVSEGDDGQADALNKGFARATGEVHGWLCSDDTLMPGALEWVGRFFRDRPGVGLVVGAAEMVYTHASEHDFTYTPRPDVMALLPTHNGIIQPSCFWRCDVVSRTPPIDASFHYAMDNELWCYLKQEGVVAVVTDRVLSRFIQSGENKTASGGKAIGLELDRLYRMYSDDRVPLSFWYRHLRYPFECWLGRDRGWMRLVPLRILQLLYMALLMPFYGYERVRRMSWPA